MSEKPSIWEPLPTPTLLQAADNLQDTAEDAPGSYYRENAAASLEEVKQLLGERLRRAFREAEDREQSAQ